MLSSSLRRAARSSLHEGGGVNSASPPLGWDRNVLQGPPTTQGVQTPLHWVLAGLGLPYNPSLHLGNWFSWSSSDQSHTPHPEGPHFPKTRG